MLVVTGVDSVVEGINTSLQSFDSELHRSNADLNLRIDTETASVAASVGVLSQELEEKLSTTASGLEAVAAQRHEQVEVRLCGMDLSAEAMSKSFDERLATGLVELKGFCTKELAEQAALVFSNTHGVFRPGCSLESDESLMKNDDADQVVDEQTKVAEQFEDLTGRLGVAGEKADGQSEALEAALGALRSEEVEPLGKLLTSVSESVKKEFAERGKAGQ